jgi:hypothetical protein
VHQLPEARELRRELTGWDGETVALLASMEAGAGHNKGHGGAHELQQVEAAVVHEREKKAREERGCRWKPRWRAHRWG